MKQLIRSILNPLGYDLVRYKPPSNQLRDSLPDLPDDQIRTVTTVKPFTMTSLDRLAALINAVNYISANKIEGDIAECGVWRGGSMMTVALTLIANKDTERSLYLYDTFEGMPPPTDADQKFDGTTATALLAAEPKGTGIWCEAGIEQVRANMISTGYPKDRIHLVKGKVEETIPQTLPGRLALLRLDTDWYASTKHELTHLFPLLDPRGILILDDYGYWKGQKQAVDEYFAAKKSGIFLHRIDFSGRIAVGTGG